MSGHLPSPTSSMLHPSVGIESTNREARVIPAGLARQLLNADSDAERLAKLLHQGERPTVNVPLIVMALEDNARLSENHALRIERKLRGAESESG